MTNDDWLDREVPCPNCKKPVRDGDRIWLDGTAYCPDCYQYFRRKYYDYKGISNEV